MSRVKAKTTFDKNCWETPGDLFDSLHRAFNFTIDACANKDNAKLPRYWTEEDNALEQPWGGERVFCNPPYSRGFVEAFCKKAHETQYRPGCSAVLLIPADTSTRYFSEYCARADYLWFIQPRIKFEFGGVVPPGSSSPPKGNMLAVFKGRTTGDAVLCWDYKKEEIM